ncbi:UNVERIFIED_CONTAM: hypothetical protein Sangu_3084600 [Sesamum angustifolium]|uniref:DDE Tnp4 domain-containing protein n=1 Tax=Sesamum angustifolium TaxID=2727405 RepID=A0AAW2K7B6_9LAMI
MQFIYVLPGWEGSAADSRVLRDAISRRNGFVVPRGSYYLVDAGYTNEGIKEAASVIGSEIAKATQLFSKAIGVEAEVSEKRQKIDSEIRKILNLTATEVIKVVCRIAQNHELTDVFFSMNEEGREQLVVAILHGDI